MRPKSMILILIALGCGLVASIGISQVMENRQSAAPAAETIQIYVAVGDIPLGEPLTPHTIKLEEWPKDKVPENAITTLEDVDGRRPRQPLFAGEPILSNKLIDLEYGTGGATDRIPKGYRALPIRVTMESGGSGLIHPGDHVDILLFMTANGAVRETTVRTILRDIRVFAVNEQVDRQTDQGDGSAILAKTVSVLVKPGQVEKLMLATNVGRLSLSLRRADDDEIDDTEGAVIGDLENAGSSKEDGSTDSEPEIASDPVDDTEESQSGGLSDLMSLITAQQAEPADMIPSEPVGPNFEMQILGPDGIQSFTWDDPNSKGLPNELDPGRDDFANDFAADDDDSWSDDGLDSGDFGVGDDDGGVDDSSASSVR